MTSEARTTTRIDGQAVRFEPHHCFACGELNEHGLHLLLHTDASGCRTELTLEPGFQGWEGVAHGGILATILDEVMGWAVIGRGTWGVTARMTVDYKRPVHVGTAIRALKAGTGKPIVVYPNSGERWDAGDESWHGAPAKDSLAALAPGWIAAGAGLVGGCCRVGPRQIAALAQVIAPAAAPNP